MIQETKEIEFTVTGLICNTCKVYSPTPNEESGNIFYSKHKDHEILLEVITEDCVTPFTMQFKEVKQKCLHG